MARKEVTYYRIPDECFFRIHYVRPRFKGNIENVLLYMAKECCKIPKSSCEEYSKQYFKAIRMFPGNIGMTEKTLHNWRTEIPALFGFYKEDKSRGVTETTEMAYFLNRNQDLTQFLRLFLFSFQFPGGHMKPQDLKSLIENNIRFKPARVIIEVLMAGNKILSDRGIRKEMSISAEEAAYCIFNDLRVTAGRKSPDQIAVTILKNRDDQIRYYDVNDPNVVSLKGKARSKGDITRYAADIMDYMEIANLLEKRHSYYRLKGNELAVLSKFVEDKTFFDGYEQFYGRKDISTYELSLIEPDWFEYVNGSMNPDMFKTDIRAVFADFGDLEVLFEDRIKEMMSSGTKTTKDIGNLGEAIVCGHEKMRLKVNGYEDFVRLVQVVDSPSYHPGFDIDSFEADGTEDHRYIEVKTTISKQRVQMYGFHMSPNEWRVAGTIKEHYCVYRLMLSEKEKVLYILRDPVGLYKSDKIDAEPRDGMEVTFSTESFKPTELLIWEK